MSINIRTITDPGECLQAVSGRQVIGRSPHVGNIPRPELDLITMLTDPEMNIGRMCVELVDTVRMDDGYGPAPPRQLVTSNDVPSSLASKKSRSKMVGSEIPINQDTLAQLATMSLPCPESGLVKDMHIQSAKLAFGDGVDVRTTGETIAAAVIEGVDLPSLVKAAVEVVDRPLRSVGADGKIVECHIATEVRQEQLYACGDEPMHGLLPSVELMCLIDIARGALSAGGSDVELVHVGGPMMIEYMASFRMQEVLAMIADKSGVFTGLGSVEYVVPCMESTISVMLDEGISSPIPADCKSQHHLIQIRNGHEYRN